ncbi:MAG: class D sortase [Oscillospiraceae bacterium]|nr:class D sortase [Oscillospiraceae bacterium]
MSNKQVITGTEHKRTKKQWALFITGLIAMIIGISILGFYAIRKICREVRKYKLMQENVVVEIADLKIKAPVLEGTENEILAKGTGHFIDTGEVGAGNYCIAGHSSIIYKEYFNNLKNIELGMEITLYDIEKNAYHYTVTENFIVEPNEVWVLNDFGDDRVTIVTCTDDGSQRQIVVGIKQDETKS